MVISGFEFGGAPGFYDPRRAQRRSRDPFAGLRYTEGRSPSLGDDGGASQQIAALQAALAQAQARTSALMGIVAQLRAALSQQARAPVPASQQTVEVESDYCPTPDSNRAAADPTVQADSVDRAWYGDHLRGAHPHDFGGGDFGDIDSDLGLSD